MGRRRRRCHRRPHRPHKARRILRGRQAGFRRSRSPPGDAVAATDAALVKDVAVAVAISFRDVSTSTLVDLSRSVAHATGVELSDTGSTSSQMPSASASASQGPPHSPRASSWFPSQSQSQRGCRRRHRCHSSERFRHSRSRLQGCLRIRTRRLPGPLHTPQASSSPHRVDVVADAVASASASQARRIRRGRRAGFRRSRSPSWDAVTATDAALV